MSKPRKRNTAPPRIYRENIAKSFAQGAITCRLLNEHDWRHPSTMHRFCQRCGISEYQDLWHPNPWK